MTSPSLSESFRKSLILMVFTSIGSMAYAVEPVDNPGRLLASNCFQCHGTNGRPVANGFDRLAGMSANEIRSELNELKTETTGEEGIMAVHAQAFSLAEATLIANYLAGVSTTPTTPTTPSDDATSYELSVTKEGGGKVISLPKGISCGKKCSKEFDSGTSITLTAVPSRGYSFSSWSGACSGSGSCTITMDMAKSVTATFVNGTVVVPTPTPTPEPTPTPDGDAITLKLEKSGKNYGTVTADIGSLSCGIGCSKTTTSYALNDVVTLSATPTSRHRFTGWSGACRGTASTCVVTMSQKREVKATFK